MSCSIAHLIVINFAHVPYVQSDTKNPAALTGSVIRLTAPGTEIVVLNTFEAVHDLFMKRSSLYSDRPRMVVMCEV